MYHSRALAAIQMTEVAKIQGLRRPPWSATDPSIGLTIATKRAERLMAVPHSAVPCSGVSAISWV
jgi:hypothetical protein